MYYNITTLMAYLKYIIKYFKNKLGRARTTNHKDIGFWFFYVEKLKMLFKLMGEIWKIIYKNIIKYWNIIILITWLILYILELLTIRRLITYTIIGIIIYGYKKIYEYTLTDKFKEKILNIKKKEKLLYYLIRINNISILMLIVNIEVKIYALIEWYQTYNYKTFNWIVLLMSMIVPLKLILSYMYTFFVNIQKHTMVEILWKRAFGLILSVLIFTNIIKILLEIYETWMTLIVLGYIYIVLIAWHDLQKKDQLELTYFKQPLNTYELQLKRNNILLGIIKMLWNDAKLDKIKFYEKYNKKFNIIMYLALNIENYKREKFLFQLRYLNQIKGMEELKNVKIEFFKKFIGSVCTFSMFENINEISFFKLFFEFLEKEQEKGKRKDFQVKEKHKKQIQYLSNYTYLQAQILLYFIWEYLKLKEKVTEENLYEMIVINEKWEYTELDFELFNFKFKFEVQDKEKYEYEKFKYLGNDKIYEEVYDIAFYLVMVEKDKEHVMFDKAFKNELYKNNHEFNHTDFELEDGEKIPTQAIISFLYTEIEGLEESYIKGLEEVKKKLIKEYKEKDLYQILKEYEGVVRIY